MDYIIDAKQLRIEMAARDINKSKLAELSKLSRGTVTSILNGRRPTVGAIEKIASALVLSPQRITDIFFCPKLTQEVSEQPR